jgi:serine/threonine-protein phosphatase 6 regulatory ankyrin repeat subunit B
MEESYFLEVLEEGGAALLRLAETVDLDWRGKDEATVLHYLASEGSEDAVRRLLDRGSSVDARDGDGRTALHYAAYRGREAVARLLVERGADVKAKDSDGDGVLSDAVRGATWATLDEEPSRRGLVSWLLDQGCDVNSRRADGLSVLHLAVSRADISVVQLLVERGADVDAAGGESLATPLSCAVVGSPSWRKFGLLLYHGASVDARNVYGHTVWQALCAEKHKMR